MSGITSWHWVSPHWTQTVFLCVLFLLKCHISQMCIPIFNVKTEDKVQWYHMRRKMCLKAIAYMYVSPKCARPRSFQQNKVSSYIPTLNSHWDFDAVLFSRHSFLSWKAGKGPCCVFRPCYNVATASGICFYWSFMSLTCVFLLTYCFLMFVILNGFLKSPSQFSKLASRCINIIIPAASTELFWRELNNWITWQTTSFLAVCKENIINIEESHTNAGNPHATFSSGSHLHNSTPVSSDIIKIIKPPTWTLLTLFFQNVMIL